MMISTVYTKVNSSEIQTVLFSFWICLFQCWRFHGKVFIFTYFLVWGQLTLKWSYNPTENTYYRVLFSRIRNRSFWWSCFSGNWTDKPAPSNAIWLAVVEAFTLTGGCSGRPTTVTTIASSASLHRTSVKINISCTTTIKNIDGFSYKN